MNFRTQITLTAQEDNQIDYSSSIAAIGSCFVENIGERLSYFKIRTLVNPFGIIFNPVAIEKIIFRIVNQDKYFEDDIFELNGQWQCSEVHSKLNTDSKSELIANLNDTLTSTQHFLKSSSHLILTLGTAWVYRDLESNEIVANCHKRPQSEFTKELLTVNQVAESLTNCVKNIKRLNPEIKIILTVSPVRHLKDGFVENSLSKAHLVSAVHHILKEYRGVTYFPSYEIMLDDLRDYRFYASDMLHPNATAIDYIWEHFKSVWVSKSADAIMKDVDTIQKGLNHRPFNPKSEAHLKFVQHISDLKINLISKFPHIQF